MSGVFHFLGNGQILSGSVIDFGPDPEGSASPVTPTSPSTSYEAAVTAIRERAEALWPGVEPAVTLGWENEAFAMPTDPATARPLPCVVIDVVWTGGDFMTIGSPGYNLARREGHVWAYAFIPRGTGQIRAHQLAARAARLFEGQDFDGVVCEAAMPGGPVSSEDGNYYGQSVSVPFQYDETAGTTSA